uniref:Uncharacterized protein n=1 Tax=Trichuris muris TaxID=70415 RepID=A0A5S6Q8A8_TRIMR
MQNRGVVSAKLPLVPREGSAPLKLSGQGIGLIAAVLFNGRSACVACRHKLWDQSKKQRGETSIPWLLPLVDFKITKNSTKQAAFTRFCPDERLRTRPFACGEVCISFARETERPPSSALKSSYGAVQVILMVQSMANIL